MLLAAGEQAAGPPKPHGHLVGDEQDVVLSRHLPDPAEEAFRRSEESRRLLEEVGAAVESMEHGVMALARKFGGTGRKGPLS